MRAIAHEKYTYNDYNDIYQEFSVNKDSLWMVEEHALVHKSMGGCYWFRSPVGPRHVKRGYMKFHFSAWQTEHRLAPKASGKRSRSSIRLQDGHTTYVHCTH